MTNSTEQLKRSSAAVIAMAVLAGMVAAGLLFPGSAAPRAETVKIAAIFALSGNAMGSNHASIRGVRNAVDQLNRQGGILNKQVNLVEIDNQSTPIGARVAAEKASQLGVSAIIGSAWSSHSLAIAKIAQRDGIPMISNISTHPDVTRTGDFVFRVCYTDETQARAMAFFARHHLKARTAVLVVNLNSDYSIVLSREFRTNFESSGGDILDRLTYKDNFEPADFTDLIRRVKAHHPRVVFLPGYVESADIILAMQENNLDCIPLGGDGWEANDFFNTVGTKMEKGYFCAHWTEQQASAGFQDYLTHRITTEPVWSAEVLAVDAVNLLAHAMEKANTTRDRSRIRNALSTVTGFQGITGTISFDANGDPVKDVVIMEIQQGNRFFNSRFSPEQTGAPR